ncbi:MAG: YqeG family HAD IIIA-type phosphatase [Oscillospiraceae bacterium]|nr:YqeG family HAD IIIA-type phosphatase [Oscillospiraceae bacterium]
MLSFLPDHIFPKITDISPDFLHQRELTLLLMDFDNTMLPYTTNTPPQELLDWIETMKAAGIKLCIVSNSRKPRVPTFCKQYDVACVTGANKPGTRGVKQALQRFDAQKKNTALVGDQIYTDVLCAKLSGVTALAVKSIHNHNIWLKLRHALEVPFLAIARKRRVKL